MLTQREDAVAKRKVKKITQSRVKTYDFKGLTMYGHRLNVCAQHILQHLREQREASRPDLGLVLAGHPKAPKWVRHADRNTRFRVVRKILDHMTREGIVTSRLGRSKRTGAEAHLYRLRPNR